jgi:hypothetical protein
VVRNLINFNIKSSIPSFGLLFSQL